MKPTVLFLHSTGTLPSMWKCIESSVLGDVTELRPANLGYPPNALINAPTAFTADEDVEHLLRQLPAEGPVHLVAHSYGGLLALRLAKRLGTRVASAFLCEPVLFGALSRSKHVDVTHLAQVHAFANHPTFLTHGGDDAWLEMFIDYWNRPGSWARMPAPMKEATRTMGWKMFQEVRAVFLDTSNFEDHALSVPLTLIKGERSPVEARLMIDELARVNPHATVVDLAGAGHMAPLSNGALVAKAFAEHWSRVLNP